LCASTICGDGQEDRITKWFKTKRPPRHFQGGKEEVERKGKEDRSHCALVQGSKKLL